MNKQFNRSDTYDERLKRIRRAGIGVIAGMIMGMDGDTTEVFERTLRFLHTTGIDALQLNILTPLPGTPLFGEMEGRGRVTDHDWSHYDYRHVVFRPARMTAEELQAGADWVYAQFYRLDRILWRFARSVFTMGWLPALLALRLGLTYRYDNRREGIVGWNPAKRGGSLEAGSSRALSAQLEHGHADQAPPPPRVHQPAKSSGISQPHACGIHLLSPRPPDLVENG